MKISKLITVVLLMAMTLALPVLGASLTGWSGGLCQTLGTSFGALGTNGGFDEAAVLPYEVVPL